MVSPKKAFRLGIYWMANYRFLAKRVSPCDRVSDIVLKECRFANKNHSFLYYAEARYGVTLSCKVNLRKCLALSPDHFFCNLVHLNDCSPLQLS